MSAEAVNFIVEPQLTLGMTLDGMNIVAARAELAKAAKDDEFAQDLDNRLVYDEFTVPADLQTAKAAYEKARQEPVSWLQWLANEADDDTLAAALNWNQETAREAARNQQWYDELDQNLRPFRAWLDNRAQTSKAFARMAERFAAEGEMPRIVVGEPLDLTMPGAYGYYQWPEAAEPGEEEFRALRRHYSSLTLGHEVLHGLGGFQNIALDEGETQQQAVKFVRSVPRLRNQIFRIRLAADIGAPLTSAQRSSLPESSYSKPRWAAQGLQRIASSTADGGFALENYYATAQKTSGHPDGLAQAICEVTGLDIIGHADRMYEEIIASSTDTSYGQRYVREDARNRVSDFIDGLYALWNDSFSDSSAPRPEWEAAYQYLKKHGSSRRRARTVY